MEAYPLNWEYVYISEALSQADSLLQSSLITAELTGGTIVLEDNRFLPEGAFSVQEIVCGRVYSDGSRKIRPRYYNEVPVPDGWTIGYGREDKSDTGKISFRHQAKGRIHYAKSTGDYCVSDVDWLDHLGTVRVTDHYDRYGDLCARTTCDSEGHPILCSWYDEAGRDVLCRNLVTGDYLYRDSGSDRIFRTKEALLDAFLKERCSTDTRYCVSSLGLPFEICKADENRKVTLFLHGPEMNGSLQLLSKAVGRLDKIFVQDRKVFLELAGMPVDRDKTDRLGFIYPFEKENAGHPEALICTNSDIIEHLPELIGLLPEVNFHITAITTMSERLTELETRGNVFLHPGADEKQRAELFRKCDIYLDINHYSELQDAVFKAFLHNHLIFAFDNTVHNPVYVPDAQIFSSPEWEKLAVMLKILLSDPSLAEKTLRKQRLFALSETAESYRSMLCGCTEE